MSVLIYSGLLMGMAFAFLVDGRKESQMLKLPEEQNSSSFSFNQSKAETVKFNTMTRFLNFLISKSPAHQLYLLYDDNYKGVDSLLKSYSGSGTKVIVTEFSPDLKGFVDAVKAPLKGTQVGRRHLLLMCSKGNAAKVFEKVAAENLENPSNWWIVFAEDEDVAKIILRVIREGSMVSRVEADFPLL
ncbi:uncharacterized protein LOC135225297 [Macrobrachium nipponense]|uniref:uncharacterized protein LOC135225297 n=1 Tax=Macrobrachium nipponense TaxID=159736 RepID=UPI0030C896AE